MLRQIPLRTATAAAPSRLLFRPSAFTATRFLTTETTASAAATQQTTAPPPPPPASFQAPATPASTPRQLAYLVERTASRNLSVYNDTRAGGSKKQTVIKKIVGDIHTLKSDIMKELDFPKDDVKINPVTGHIKIKGFHADKVTKWLQARGF